MSSESVADTPHVVLLTGAGGKLGLPFSRYLKNRGYVLRSLVRSDSSERCSQFEMVCDWPRFSSDPEAAQALLRGVTSVVHLASSNSADEEQNRDAHLRMPQQLLDVAQSAGVARFISLSSIKALAGEAHNTPLAVGSHAQPNSDYGEAKLAAETMVREHPANRQLATFTLRLPMVYGPGIDGSFALLRRAAERGLPIPVAADNQRSFLFSENLFAALEHLLEAPVTPGHQLLHLADGEAVSTRTFYQLIADAQASSGRCITLSCRWADRLTALPVVGPISARLLGSLQFDSASLYRSAEWQMPYTTAAGIAATVAADS